MSVIITRPTRGARRFPQGRPAINRQSWQAHDLIHWFPLRAGYAPSVDVVTGQALGQSDVNNPPAPTVMRFGRGVEMSKTTAADYYTNTSFTTALDITNGASVSFWFKILDAIGGNQHLLDYSGSGVRFLTWVHSSRLKCFIDGDGAAQHPFVDPFTITDTWYHVTVTADESEPRVNIYHDGYLGVTHTTSWGATSGWTKLSLCGSSEATSGPNAILFDVRVYNRALTASEAKAIYHPSTRFDLWWEPNRVFYSLPEPAEIEVTPSTKGGLSLSEKRMRELERLQMLQRDDDEIMALLSRWLR